MPIIKTLKNGQWVKVNSIDTIATATTTTAGLMSASDKEKLDEAIDYIVEQGTSGIWTYRKWNSGIAECWGKTNLTTTIEATFGSIYNSSEYVNEAYPSGLFYETPIVNASADSTGYAFWVFQSAQNISSKNQTGSFKIARGSSYATSQTYKITFYAIGRWK